MKFQELDVVRTTKSFPQAGIASGQVGTVVSVFSAPREAYQIEFCDEAGETLAMFPIEPQFLAIEEPMRLAA